ncbi:2-phospho-L-lactate transferase [Alphaproteobacteria bacterium]|jgi:LPPG:FO 2-phospho-L-lactate transferase|nr:2-phospho-L-lactate transferase [Alphaproteobacteria bacterium]
MTRCIALSGGVGGAKLALGLSKILTPDELLIVANTGDDFEHLGLTICPDIDTLLYTLAGIANPDTGWGRANESWETMKTLKAIGGETWFRLGDLDLALHLTRTQQLASGKTLSDTVAGLAKSLGLKHPIIPMSDQPVRTMVRTEIGELPFQEYFVKNQCLPKVSGFQFAGVTDAKPNPRLMDAFNDPRLEAVIFCPSNPFISIDPILAIPGLREDLRARSAPTIAVSPIIGNRALKGPAAKMLRELGFDTSAAAIADHYGDLLQGFVIDSQDIDLANNLETKSRRVHATNTVMKSLEDRVALARETFAFASQI